jgi:HTH-type transcriptional regulator/antitoxin HigA
MRLTESSQGGSPMYLSLKEDIYGKLLAEFQPKIITSEQEYDRMLETVKKLM